MELLILQVCSPPIPLTKSHFYWNNLQQVRKQTKMKEKRGNKKEGEKKGGRVKKIRGGEGKY